MISAFVWVPTVVLAMLVAAWRFALAYKWSRRARAEGKRWWQPPTDRSWSGKGNANAAAPFVFASLGIHGHTNLILWVLSTIFSFGLMIFIVVKRILKK